MYNDGGGKQKEKKTLWFQQWRENQKEKQNFTRIVQQKTRRKKKQKNIFKTQILNTIKWNVIQKDS